MFPCVTQNFSSDRVVAYPEVSRFGLLLPVCRVGPIVTCLRGIRGYIKGGCAWNDSVTLRQRNREAFQVRSRAKALPSAPPFRCTSRQHGKLCSGPSRLPG
jgi:hypothetical protein